MAGFVYAPKEHRAVEAIAVCFCPGGEESVFTGRIDSLKFAIALLFV
jgi:hypothetical protein